MTGSEESNAGARRLSVLLVEDDLFDFQVVKRALRSSPHITLVHAENLAQAVEAVQSEPFDCLILDWYLPDGDGEQFLSYAADAVPWTPTIIMTSGMEDLLTDSALALGAQDYILKGGFDAEGLQRSIEFAIARKHAERVRWNNLQVERMSFVNQIVAGVAHEINNPVAWIHSNIDLLRMQFEQDDVDVEEAIELCQECIEGVTRISSVVRVLRTYAEAGEKRMELYDVESLLDGVFREVRGLREWNVKSSIIKPQSLPRVLMDPNSFHKALFQIILNAFQAASTRAFDDDNCMLGFVEIELSIAERQLVLDVHDSGFGLDKEVASRIFEPFYSSQRTTNLGMGLAIARDVIMNHRGSIAVMRKSHLGGAWLQTKLPVM